MNSDASARPYPDGKRSRSGSRCVQQIIMNNNTSPRDKVKCCCFCFRSPKEEGLGQIPVPDECGIGGRALVLENDGISRLARGLRKEETEKRKENEDKKAFLL